VIKKALVSAAIALGAALAVAAPANADPSAFGTLSCSCSQPAGVPDSKAPVIDQMNKGIQRGLAFLPATPARP
jgi:hypothetical protein